MTYKFRVYLSQAHMHLVILILVATLIIYGDAEMRRVIEKTANKISRQKYVLELDAKKSIDLDETELKKYVDLVIREVRKDIPT